jgi:hypothetical protein
VMHDEGSRAHLAGPAAIDLLLTASRNYVSDKDLQISFLDVVGAVAAVGPAVQKRLGEVRAS